ncbi:MAG: sigma-70 family RNA polymerase sigma factor [Bacteroidetes bacterium]|nr:sigma-70 family RNA polymerase sigma factor [Bacteroidota bacterium]
MDRKSNHIDTDTLLHKYQQGDRNALKLLIKRFHQTLLKTIRYTTNSQSAAEDIAQECWYAIVQQLDKLEIKINFDAWALTIARRKSIDWIREQQRERKYARQLQMEANAESDVQNETSEQTTVLLLKIQNGILQLPPTQRIVLNMFYLDNLSLKEISQHLDIPEGTIKSRLFTARESLKEILKTQNEE